MTRWAMVGKRTIFAWHSRPPSIPLLSAGTVKNARFGLFVGVSVSNFLYFLLRRMAGNSSINDGGSSGFDKLRRPTTRTLA